MARLSDAENIEPSKVAIVFVEKHKYWKERIEAAGQGGKMLFVWLLEQDFVGAEFFGIFREELQLGLKACNV